jgi:hypothetical protein
MLRLAIAILLSPAAFAQESGIAVAAKSPLTLARYIEAHREDVDWAGLWKALGTQAPRTLYPLCGGGVYSCSTEIVTVVNPDQAILIIQSSGVRTHDIYIRYLQEQDGSWRFGGLSSATLYDGYPRQHEMIRVRNKPFLSISSNLSQVGGGFSQLVEDWFDLTQPDFEPVFSLTTDASVSFGYPIWRDIKAQASPVRGSGVETIEVSLTVAFNGVGRDLGENMFGGVYERPAGEKTFTLRSAHSGHNNGGPIPIVDFEALAGLDLAAEQSLKYAFPALKDIATGSNAEAKQWLRDALGQIRSTPEKETLLELLAKP